MTNEINSDDKLRELINYASANKLRELVKYAVDHGWQVEGHNGEHPTSLHPKPDQLRWTAEYLVETETFLAFVTSLDFLQAVLGDEYDTLNIYPFNMLLPLEKINFLHKKISSK